jgi:hypothetical protein
VAAVLAGLKAILHWRRTGWTAEIAGPGWALAKTRRGRAHTKIELLHARHPCETAGLLAEAKLGTRRDGGSEVAATVKSTARSEAVASAKAAAVMLPRGDGTTGEITLGALRWTELEASLRRRGAGGLALRAIALRAASVGAIAAGTRAAAAAIARTTVARAVAITRAGSTLALAVARTASAGIIAIAGPRPALAVTVARIAPGAIAIAAWRSA